MDEKELYIILSILVKEIKRLEFELKMKEYEIESLKGQKDE